MSAFIEVELVCDGVAPDWYCEEPRVYAGSVRLVRESATRLGWLVDQQGARDYCPVHRPQAEFRV